MGLLDSNPTGWLPQSDGQLRIIAHQESLINDGLSWQATYQEVVGTATAVTLMVTAPASGELHTTIQIDADKAGTWTWSESPNASGGTAVTSYNHNRQSTSSDPVGTVKSAITFTSAGTILSQGGVGTGGNPSSQGGGEDQLAEKWILATSGTYLARFTAAAATTTVTLSLHYDLVS